MFVGFNIELEVGLGYFFVLECFFVLLQGGDMFFLILN